MRKAKYVEKWGLDTAKERYGGGKDGGMTAADESQPEFRQEKISDHVDSDGWVRGKGKDSPYPDFDHGKLDRRPPRKS